MKIKYSKRALKFLTRQEKATVARIKGAIEKLLYTPPEGDIKPLQGYKDKMRLRIGGFRVVYWYTAEKGLEIPLYR